MSKDINYLPAVQLSEDELLEQKTNIHFSKISEEYEQENHGDFPLDIFPELVQRIILATSTNLQFPKEFISSSLLYVTSIATGNSVQINFKNGWAEQGVVYLVLVGNPGTNKSYPVLWALKPIYDYDRQLLDLYQQQMDDFLLDLEQKSTKEKKDKCGNQKPLYKKILLSDYTIEALVEILNNNQQGIGVHVDEFAGWFKNFDRYTKKGSEQEIWLKIWSGMPVIVDRKISGPVSIRNPFVSIIGGIQPGILGEVSKDGRLVNGFIDRLLFVYPDNLKKQAWNHDDVHPSIPENWKRIVNMLLQLRKNTDGESSTTISVSISNQAKEKLFSWQKRNADLINNIESEAIQGIYSKLETHVMRFSLLLHLLFYTSDNTPLNEISLTTTERAIKLVEYFRYMNTKTLRHVSNSNPLDRQTLDKQRFYTQLPATFKTHEGLALAEKFSIKERTAKRFFDMNDLFTKTSHGHYQKKS